MSASDASAFAVQGDGEWGTLFSWRARWCGSLHGGRISEQRVEFLLRSILAASWARSVANCAVAEREKALLARDVSLVEEARR